MERPKLQGATIVYLVSEDWYFLSHRLPVARAARDLGMRVIVATKNTNQAEAIEDEGFEFFHIPFDRSGLNPLYDLRVLTLISRLYRRVRPDIVHHVGAKPIMLGQIAAAVSGVPRVINAMAGMGFLYVSTSRKAKILRAVFERSIVHLNHRDVMRILVQNHDDKDIFEKFSRLKNKVVLIPGSGVDCVRFNSTPEPDGELVAVCVSRLLRDKGIYELVEAARLLRSRSFPIRIKLVGSSDANPTNITSQDLAEWTSEGVVEVCGPSADIPREYSRAHIAVLCSYREGLPKSLLEAAACARPIVATDVPGCRSICLDGENGILVPARDPHAIADALMALGNDPKLRLKMGRAGRRLVLKHFSKEIIAQMTMDLYDKLIILSR